MTVKLKNVWLEARAEKRIEQTIEELQKLGLQADEDQGLAPKEARVKLLKALYGD